MLGGCAIMRTPDARSLRLTSYNVQYGGGGGKLDSIREVIRGSGAAIIALQEVDVHWGARSGFVDQAATLGEALGMHDRYAPIYTIADAEDGRPRGSSVSRS